MRNRVLLAGLLLLGPACAHAPAPDKLPKLRGHVPAFRVPGSISAASYKNQRDIYSALPVHAPGREAFRQRLLEHLLGRLDEELKRSDDSAAMKTFVGAVTLFHPAEVFGGRVREPRLAAVAARIAQVFSPRGDEEHVLLPLCVEMSLGDERRARAAIEEIVGWVNETQQLVHGPAARGAQLIRVLEKVARSWPSAFVVERLRSLYIERRFVLARTMNGDTYRHLKLALPTLLQGAAFQTGYRIARLYLRVDRPYQALSHMRELAGTDRSSDDELRQLLEQAVAPTANVRDQVRLAEHFEERDREISLRVCEAATERFPAHAAAYECMGRFAAATERLYLAVVSLERAVQLAPEQLAYSETLAQHYQRRLFDMIGDDQLDEAEAEALRIEAFYHRTEQRFRTRLKPSLARVYYALGHGYFNAGRVARATAAFERSTSSEPTPDALVQLAMIRLKKEDVEGALRNIDRAEQSLAGSPPERVFWKARLHGLRGRAFELAGKPTEARREHAAAVESWHRWQAVGLRPEAQAEAYVYEAQSLYPLGEKSRALDALERAIDTQPDRKETYADVIAMLITHGHLPEALDALHRALGRSEVSEYLKTYCSLWVVGLARRAGLRPDDLAMTHLRNLSGTSWYVRLAHLSLGKARYEDLQREARTLGNKAELYYYWADQLLSQGKLNDARDLWRKVLDSDMLGFYEYEMSFFNLRNGAATVNTRPLDRQPAP